jgi:hypothetical protein
MEDNMEKLRVIFVFLGCLLFISMASAQVPGELPLTNPGFEDGDLTGWSLWPTSGTNQSVSSDAANSGTYALKTVGVDVAVYQTINNPTAGKVYAVRGWAMNPSSDSLAAGQKLRMEITIFDGSWGQLLQVYSDSITSESATDEWQKLFVVATCPEGAVYMNVGFNWIGTGDAGTPGSAHGDDMRLVEMDVPEGHGNFGFEDEERDPWWHWGYLSVSPDDSVTSVLTDVYSRTGSQANKVVPQDWNLWVDEWWWGGYYLWTAQTIYDQVDYFEAGDAFYMSAWVMTPSDEQIFGSAYMSLELNFKDDAGTTISKDLGGRVGSKGIVDEWANGDEWYFIEAFIECPDVSGTNIDRIDMTFVLQQYGDAEGAFIVDDVTIVSTPFRQDSLPPEPPISGTEQLVAGGFGAGADTAWTVYQLTDAATATVDFNYTDDGPTAGEGAALSVSGDVDAHVLVFQELELIAGATYMMDGGFKDISSVSLDCNWIQMYLSTEMPVEGQDYQAIGGENTNRYVGFESWAGPSPSGLDGTFAKNGHVYNENKIVMAGTPGETVTAYYAIKIGSCGPTFTHLFDNMSLLLIDLPEPAEKEMLVNGGFGTQDGWNTLKLTGAAADATFDFNYTDDGPSAGEGAALRVSGGTDAHELLYQTVTVQKGVSYRIAGAIKDISGTALSCNWLQIYASSEDPVEGTDYQPNEYRFLTFDTWEGGGAYSGAGIDGTFEDDANRYGNDSTFVLVPGPLGEEMDIHFAAKVGSCGDAFDWLLDNMSFMYEGVGEVTALDDISTIEVPDKFALDQNYPNPFNPTTTIAFHLDKNETVKLTIYDIMGRQIRTLVNNRMDRGSHLVIWDGKNNFGQPVATGTYIYTLSTGNRHEMKRMTLIK